jgi:signal transduction histidine kinase
MHPSSLIPLAALLVSAAFAAVSLAWDSERRATRSMGAIFGCTGAWALIELLAAGETDPSRALVWLRWMHLPLLLIGPSVLWVMREISPRPPPQLMRTVRLGALVAVALGCFAAGHPKGLEGVVSTPFGWMPVYGAFSVWLIPLGTLLPFYGAVSARLNAAGEVRSDRDRAQAMGLAVSISIGIAALTEYLLPLAGVPSPRLGALATALCSAVLWLRALYLSDDLSLTPQGISRAVLARLHDGVLLVDPEGRILSTNQRFLEMVDEPHGAIISSRVADWLDVEASRLRAGLEDSPCFLRRREGAVLAVSLSASVAHNGSGDRVGTVLVVRDRREIEALRARLVESGRLAAVGELAAGIAHEVNNPIAFIRSDLNLLSERLEEIERQAARVPDAELELAVLARSRRRIATARDGIDRVATVVGDVRDFAHAGGATQGGSDPEAVIEAAMRLARMERGDEVTMRIAEVAGVGRIENGQELKQILLGLLRAAADRLSKGGAIELRLRIDEHSLLIALHMGPLGEGCDELLQTLSRSGTLEAGYDTCGFGIAAMGELLEGIGGRLEASGEEDRTARVELVVPVVGGDER